MTLETILFLITGTLIALLTGLFFGYSVSVNWALHRLKNSEYVRAMQEINDVIQNPLFLLTFLGPVILLPLLTFLYGNPPDHPDFVLRFYLLAGASVFYIVGPFGLTIAGNVPLNNKLAKFNEESATEKEVEAERSEFEKPWNRLHTIRTVASVIALILFFAAILLP
ncbi:DUF1772 domain-containing protein [Leptospira ilyithenensis]|uniref:DUF1772 domain-containing protein n=1 Tax=Leptospira ilyithenensis TaxID=2484901 RepID=A0A4R9LT49_9LEPT|nr:anthrone oxygenase family protein [Leptospira ilyithenensis]TGN14677.1 DUF1772 domain-containing protein [Leptospira ilyithenensis]